MSNISRFITFFPGSKAERDELCEKAGKYGVCGWLTKRPSGEYEALLSAPSKTLDALFSEYLPRLFSTPGREIRCLCVDHLCSTPFAFQSKMPGWEHLQTKQVLEGQPEHIAKIARNSIRRYQREGKSTAQHLYYLAATLAKMAERPDGNEASLSDDILAGIAIDHIQERFKLSPLKTGFSFRACLTLQQRWDTALRRANGSSPWHKVNNKIRGQAFARSLGIPVPELVYSGTAAKIPWSELKGKVLKPLAEASSRGVYLIIAENNILNLAENRNLSSLAALRDEVLRYQESRSTGSDHWIAETLVSQDGTPPRDLKLYCFYGHIGLALEAARYPKKGYFWSTPDGTPIKTGKFSDQPLKPSTYCVQANALAIQLSRALPVPFMRIDFLIGDDGPVFCEFTPYPGRFDQFNGITNFRLGKDYVEAQARLYQDLITGKSFPFFSHPATVD